MSTPDSVGSPATSPTDPPLVASHANPLPKRLWLWTLSAGLIAGVVAGLCGEAVYGWFQPVLVYPPGFEKLSPFDKPDVISGLLRKEEPGVELKNTAVATGLLGAALGGALGLVGGLARRSLRSGLIAGVVGAFAAAAIGAVMAAILTPIFYRSVDPETGLELGILIHSGLWVPIGAVAGLAFGLGLGRGTGTILKALLGGLAGAVLGTLMSELGDALAFSNVRLDKPIPDDWHCRILAVFCVSICSALGAALSLGARKSGKSGVVKEV